ncbi:MAG: hypothetical protein ACRBCI_00735 [Cellvibrionaceae bacterium]
MMKLIKIAKLITQLVVGVFTLLFTLLWNTIALATEMLAPDDEDDNPNSIGNHQTYGDTDDGDSADIVKRPGTYYID